MDRLSILINLVRNHYDKLTDARNIYEIISRHMNTLDDPKQLIEFLTDYLKPKEFEKKQNGEVFTPPSLINEKLDKLQSFNSSIWSDPNIKVLDPSNGIGNYPALIFHRLMTGLSDKIPNKEERKKHILENMLYICEINKKNVEVCKKLFDPSNKYKLNIFEGSYFDLDCKKVFGVEGFDLIVGNPPYNAPGKGASGNTIWQLFVKKSLTELKSNGYLLFVHPNGWRKPNSEKGKFNGMFDHLTKSNQLLYLEMHNSKDGMKTFKCGTQYDWYVLQKKPNYTTTSIKDTNNIESVLDLKTYSWLASSNHSIIDKLLVKSSSDEVCKIMYDRSAYGADKKDRMSSTKDDIFKYVCIHSTPKSGVRYMYSKFNNKGHFGVSKVIFGEAGIHNPILDMEGEYGMTHGAMGIEISSLEEGKKIQKGLQSKMFQTILESCSFSSFRIDWNLFKYFKQNWFEYLDESEESEEVVNNVIEHVLEDNNEYDYESFTLVKLKELCKSKGLKVSGKKSVLIERLKT
jgi:hypothetical protein